ncbi:MAG: glycosyltransferase involved in cell wall biosynthesis [Chlamydiales bacterium]|jgi:glycosyltransferase involved in cell wall biosynthesis
MHIIYPYNEILPKRTAHDVYIFNNCVSLAKEGFQVELLCGKGSQNDGSICEHYHVPNLYGMKTKHLPIVRKNNILSLSWNRVFLYFSQRVLQQEAPDVAIFSVLKQAYYHFRRKLPGVSYVYEAHQLAWYPHMALGAKKKEVELERSILRKADLVTVTTEALRKILLEAPYSLDVPVEVVPLAVNVSELPPPLVSDGLPTVMYVGQLYKGQGIENLLNAMGKASTVRLEIVGGTETEIKNLKAYSVILGVSDRVYFHGFCSPSKLSSMVAHADAFVAPFEPEGRMPYVAHTKLLEYISWGRPVIAPDMPVVREHFPDGKGLMLFESGSTRGLADRLCEISQPLVRDGLQKESSENVGAYNWHARSKHYGEILKNLF